MKISYAITAWNEYKELETLLTHLIWKKRKQDEIIVQTDNGKTTDEVYDVLKEYRLFADTSNHLSFSNYYRKNNFTENVSYNGNASFFLEPLEATSLNVSIRTINQCLKSLSDGNLQQQNDRYQSLLKETIDIIMLHYLVDPPVKNMFWEYANDKAKTWLSDRYKNYPKIRLITNKSSLYYSTWFEGSFKQNLTGLDLYDKLNKFKHD